MGPKKRARPRFLQNLKLDASSLGPSKKKFKFKQLGKRSVQHKPIKKVIRRASRPPTRTTTTTKTTETTEKKAKPTYSPPSSEYLKIDSQQALEYGFFDQTPDLYRRNRNPTINNDSFCLENLVKKSQLRPQPKIEEQSFDSLLHPKHAKDLVGLSGPISLLKSFLDHPHQIGCFILGPVGCGKSIATKLLIEECNKTPEFFDHGPDFCDETKVESKKKRGKDNMPAFQRCIETVPSGLFSHVSQVAILDNCSLKDGTLKRMITPSLHHIDAHDIKNFTKWIVIPDDDHQKCYEELRALSCIVTIEFKSPKRSHVFSLSERMPEFPNRGKLIQSYIHRSKQIDVRNFVETMRFKSIQQQQPPTQTTKDIETELLNWLGPNISPTLKAIITKKDEKKDDFHMDTIDNNFAIITNAFKNIGTNIRKIGNMQPLESIGFIHTNLLTVADCKHQNDRNRRAVTLDECAKALDFLSLADTQIGMPHSSHYLESAVSLVKTSYKFDRKDHEKYRIIFSSRPIHEEHFEEHAEHLDLSYTYPYNQCILPPKKCRPKDNNPIAPRRSIVAPMYGYPSQPEQTKIIKIK